MGHSSHPVPPFGHRPVRAVYSLSQSIISRIFFHEVDVYKCLPRGLEKSPKWVWLWAYNGVERYDDDHAFFATPSPRPTLR